MNQPSQQADTDPRFFSGKRRNPVHIRRLYAVLILLTIPLGLGSRKYGQHLNGMVAAYAGDILFATCLFFVLRFFMTRSSLLKAGIISYAVCVAIELQQLIRWPWFVELRDKTPMGILLGHGFLWSDLLCYAAGALLGLCIGAVLERVFVNR